MPMDEDRLMRDIVSGKRDRDEKARLQDENECLHRELLELRKLIEEKDGIIASHETVIVSLSRDIETIRSAMH